ncbi:hypothetical protein GCM10027030_20850 [Luteococcus sediminum]
MTGESGVTVLGSMESASVGPWSWDSSCDGAGASRPLNHSKIPTIASTPVNDDGCWNHPSSPDDAFHSAEDG